MEIKLTDYKNLSYPSLDHKTSVLYGFLNDIDPKEISRLDNLCITKLHNNMSKGELNEEEYKNKIKI